VTTDFYFHFPALQLSEQTFNYIELRSLFAKTTVGFFTNSTLHALQADPIFTSV